MLTHATALAQAFDAMLTAGTWEVCPCADRADELHWWAGADRVACPVCTLAALENRELPRNIARCLACNSTGVLTPQMVRYCAGVALWGLFCAKGCQ